MKYSIIVPVHNNEKLVEKAVLSLLDNRFEIEVLLLENSSSDNSYEKCLELSNKYSNVHTYKVDGNCVSEARNLGLKLATGDIICFSDSDDYYEPNVIEKVDKLFKEKDIDMLITGYYDVVNSEKTLKAFKEEKYLTNKQAFIQILNSDKVMGSVWNKFYKKELLVNSSFPVGINLMEDTCFNVDVLSKNKNTKIYISSMPTYNYVHNPRSATGNKDYLFDKNNNANYINAVEYMENNYSLNSYERSILSQKRFNMSIYVINETNNPVRYNKLYGQIKKNYLTSLSRFYLPAYKRNLLNLSKGLKYLIKGKK